MRSGGSLTAPPEVRGAAAQGSLVCTDSDAGGGALREGASALCGGEAGWRGGTPAVVVAGCEDDGAATLSVGRGGAKCAGGPRERGKREESLGERWVAVGGGSLGRGAGPTAGPVAPGGRWAVSVAARWKNGREASTQYHE